MSALSREALEGPFSKLNGIGHAIYSKPHELAPERGLQFIVPFEIRKGFGVEMSALSREALEGPFSKLNGIGHAIYSKPHELAPERGIHSPVRNRERDREPVVLSTRRQTPALPSNVGLKRKKCVGGF
jgi:hypothetical protein